MIRCSKASLSRWGFLWIFQDALDAEPQDSEVHADVAAAPAANIPANLPANLEQMIAEAVSKALKANQEPEYESDSDAEMTESADVLDDEDQSLGEAINAAVAATIELRLKNPMTAENLAAKRRKYNSIPSNLSKVLTPTKINTELYGTLPLFTKTHDKR